MKESAIPFHLQGAEVWKLGAAQEPLLAHGIPFIPSSVQTVLSPPSKELVQTMGLFHSNKAGDQTGFDTQHRFYYTHKPELLYLVSKLVFLQR